MLKVPQHKAQGLESSCKTFDSNEGSLHASPCLMPSCFPCSNISAPSSSDSYTIMGCGSGIAAHESHTFQPRIVRVSTIQKEGKYLLLVKLVADTRPTFPCVTGQLVGLDLNYTEGDLKVADNEENGAVATSSSSSSSSIVSSSKLLNFLRACPTADFQAAGLLHKPRPADRFPVLKNTSVSRSFSCLMPAGCNIARWIKVGSLLKVTGFSPGFVPESLQSETRHMVMVADGPVAMSCFYPVFRRLMMEPGDADVDRIASTAPMRFTVLYQEEDRRSLCFSDDLDQWESDVNSQRGIKTNHTLHIEYVLKTADDDWGGRVGKVTPETLKSVCDLRNANIFIAGKNAGPLKDLTHALKRAGVPNKRVKWFKCDDVGTA